MSRRAGWLSLTTQCLTGDTPTHCTPVLGLDLGLVLGLLGSLGLLVLVVHGVHVVLIVVVLLLLIHLLLVCLSCALIPRH